MNDDSRRNTDSDQPQDGASDSPFESTSGGRREPVFTDFDEDEDYEEAERDTDYASAYEEELEEDEYLEPAENDDPEDLDSHWQSSVDDRVSDEASEAANPWVEPQVADTGAGLNEPPLEEYDDEEDEYDLEPYDEDDLDQDSDSYQLEPGARPDALAGLARPVGRSQQGWDEDDYSDDPQDMEEELEPGSQSWPLGLVIVGIVALVLLAAGGYGVIQQRSATQEEIRQLQATLATAASPADVEATREALGKVEEQNEKLRATVERLSLENRRLGDTITSLEKQLATQQVAPSKVPAPQAAPTKPKPAPPPPKKPKAEAAASAPTGPWFVNFSSYGERSVADNWAKKLKPTAGEAVVAPSTRDGKTFYRVRIVGLANKAQAQKVAGELQQAYKLPPLWVGSQ